MSTKSYFKSKNQIYQSRTFSDMILIVFYPQFSVPVKNDSSALPVYSILDSVPPDEANYGLPGHEEFLHVEAYTALPLHVLTDCQTFAPEYPPKPALVILAQ